MPTHRWEQSCQRDRGTGDCISIYLIISPFKCMAQDNRLSIFCTLLITHYDYIKGVIKEISSQSGEVLRGSFSMCEIPRIPGRWMGYGVCWGRK